MSLYMKNTSGSDGTFAGIALTNGSYSGLLSVTDKERLRNSSTDLSHITAGTLTLATSTSGTEDIADPAAALEQLFDVVPTSLADPFPLNEGNYSFRGTGTTGTLNGSGTNGGVTDIDFLVSETRYIDAADVWIDDASLYGLGVDFIVVDKDNVLGGGANVDVEQFGYTWNIHPGSRNAIHPGYPAIIYAGLYIRCRVTNPNTSGATLYVNFFLHKKAP